MLKFKKLIPGLIFFVAVMLFADSLHAQSAIKKDTVYYLLDTTKTSVKDRMFLVGQEGAYYGYRLTCECGTYNQDVVFTRLVARKGEILTRAQVEKLNFISLRQLIHLVVKYGIDKKKNTVYYFIEPYEEDFVKYKVFLSMLQPPTKG
ncbi:hypothetical protein [Mucilaginibacter sp. KACC 22063]|uniref:hypothetical protein n=1 Tax=Mucilaginibacter sp. KACC 22063 TaxID=3025666 RepID=UPI002366A5DB|nr:hypothetical protein [Mucilaginibacter sp. KACC 22063]WDF56705.1 hypothetical protein PQ461_06520 [Mucilaginibacter sp. KACC 22063]